MPLTEARTGEGPYPLPLVGKLEASPKQKSPPKRAFPLQRKQEVAHRSGLTEFTALQALADL